VLSRLILHPPVRRIALPACLPAWLAGWLVGQAIDLSVVGLLTDMRFLSLHGCTYAQMVRLQRMPRFCGLLTLNTAGALEFDVAAQALLLGGQDKYDRMTAFLNRRHGK
jgi:hypothetical protein